MRARFRSISTRRKTEDNGFSFIELLAYMAIAALLILAAIPQFNQYREKAAISNLQSDARNLATTIEADYTTSLTYPATGDFGTTTTPGTATVNTGSVQKLSFTDEKVAYVKTTGADAYTFTLSTGKTTTTVKWDSANGGLQR
ncbi:hypothetical protein GCM10025867_48540 (plasmid) [Frondihabitans sucicola]|uniref:Prepilin-type N-terminal cleavage/methylation domain-containing protein n=1 Tax=Frondihabitans sucicola TaxID=1268041 RepID=A0ABM8GVW5_9MICO|nr:prepilin-type N-terminal cleavage/methylation domain-containing protein [Frondihabitans sucicola]BDZ52613.1 hypothetical protein GCM10025867_48540 [Frondihabitans sucicola]